MRADVKGGKEFRSHRHARDIIVKAIARTPSDRDQKPIPTLKKSSDFSKVNSKAKRFSSKHFVFLNAVARTDNLRLGITVSKKIDKRAAQRNKLRRRIKEIMRANKMWLKEAIDLVIIARPEATACSFAEIKQEIIHTLTRMGCMQKES